MYSWHHKLQCPTSYFSHRVSLFRWQVWWHSPYPMSTSRKSNSKTACGIPMFVPLYSATTHDLPLLPSLTSANQWETKKQNQIYFVRKKERKKWARRKVYHDRRSSSCLHSSEVMKNRKSEAVVVWIFWTYNGVFLFLPSSQWVCKTDVTTQV